ncbi:MAG: M20/M25/M40 family metallo-hydrolase, partial [Planctomycetes bacterium]|nr:M20/M25/M40 family metallo-hydrolase [Planctomycetota bacterium]
LGLEWMADEGMLDADFGLIPDIDNGMHEVSIAEKGAFFLKITSSGKQAHGSTPEKGINAVWLMIDLLNEVRRMDLDFAPDPLFTPPTSNLGLISGGSAPNIVPGQCEAQIDFRFLPSQNAEEIEQVIMIEASRIEEANEGARFSFERMMKVDPMRIDPANTLVRRLQDKAEAVLGWRPRLKGLSGSTVAKPLVRTGVPAVGFGPGEECQAHAANESIAVEELLNFAKVLGTFLIKEES